MSQAAEASTTIRDLEHAFNQAIHLVEVVNDPLAESIFTMAGQLELKICAAPCISHDAAVAKLRLVRRWQDLGPRDDGMDERLVDQVIRYLKH